MAILVLLLLAVFLLSFRPPAGYTHHVVNIYFGVPGSGKTTIAAYLTRQSLRDGWVIRLCRRWSDFPLCRRILAGKHFRRATPVYSNVPIIGAFQLDVKADIGHYMIDDARIIIDEAGIEYNNRNFKSFSPEAIYFYKMHRHYETSVDVFSQSYEDMDVTLRRLAQNFFVVHRSLVPFCITYRLIWRKVEPDKNTHQMGDLYYLGRPVVDTRRVFCPPLWRMFNTYSRRELPRKEWVKW